MSENTPTPIGRRKRDKIVYETAADVIQDLEKMKSVLEDAVGDFTPDEDCYEAHKNLRRALSDVTDAILSLKQLHPEQFDRRKEVRS